MYSKPIQSELYPETSQESVCTPIQSKLDVDLVDTIKFAVAKLKNINEEQGHSKRKRFAKYPCSICEKNCSDNQEAIYCTCCLNWVHRKCNGTSKTEYVKLTNEPDGDPFHCMLCIMKENSQIFPFFFFDKSQLLQLNGIDLPSQLKLLESYDVKSKLTSMPGLHDFDMDENLIHKVNSKYYDIMDFSEVKENAHQFSLFHVNLRSLSLHHDELRLLLNTLKCCFDIIGISETKEPSDGFLNNVTLDGYDLHSKYSNSAAGGVAIYIRSNLDYIIRDDLSIVEDEFETLWVEIKKQEITECPVLLCL